MVHMLTLLLLMAFGQEPASSATIGSVTATIGEVAVQRGGQTLRAEYGFDLESGDRIVTPAGGGASILVNGVLAMYIGPEAVVVLDSSEQTWIVDVQRGDARAIVGEGGITLATPSADAQLAQSIIWLSSQSNLTRFCVEAGAADI